jgi:hypothetical protein
LQIYQISDCSIGFPIDIEGLENIYFTDVSLNQTMQYVLDNNIPQFHLILEFGGMTTNLNGARDGFKIEKSDDIYILIKYRV